jgi:hypothetical protein
MAIKGKGRSKRRGVAAAPKPAYVQVKKPLLARRSFQIGVLVTIAVIALGSVTAALVVKHNANQRDALKEEETSIVRRFGASIDSNLSGVGQPFQTTFTPFPDLSKDVADLKSGALTPADAIDKAKGYASAAREAGTGILQIPAAKLIQGHADLLPLNDAQTLISDGLQVFEQAADALKLAAQASEADRPALIAHAEKLLSVAGAVFGDGYQKLVNERSRFDLLIPTQPTAPTPAA